MYDKESYQKYKESHKRATKKYYLKHKDNYRKWHKLNYHKNREHNILRSKIWVEKHKDWNREYQRKYKSMLPPDRIPEVDEYDTFCVDLNIKIEKEGFINGSKC